MSLSHGARQTWSWLSGIHLIFLGVLSYTDLTVCVLSFFDFNFLFLHKALLTQVRVKWGVFTSLTPLFGSLGLGLHLGSNVWDDTEITVKTMQAVWQRFCCRGNILIFSINLLNSFNLFQTLLHISSIPLNPTMRQEIGSKNDKHHFARCPTVGNIWHVTQVTQVTWSPSLGLTSLGRETAHLDLKNSSERSLAVPLSFQSDIHGHL